MKLRNPNAAALAFTHAPHLPIVGDLHPLRAQYHPMLYRALGFALFVHLAVFSGILLASLRRPLPPPERTIVVHWERFLPPAPIDIGRTARQSINPVPSVTKLEFAAPEFVPDFRVDPGVTFGGPEDLPLNPLDPGAGGGDGDVQIVVDIPAALPTGNLTPTTIERSEEMPVLISMPAPTYPDLARQAGVEGTVTLRALVGKDGKVLEIFVVEGIEMLDKAAMEAARAAVFKPALQQHKPVAVWVLIPMQFTLH